MPNQEVITMVNVNSIVPSKYQPRKTFDDKSLEELASSIKIHGILNPIILRVNGDKYEIVAGERRYRAAIKLGMQEVPAIIKRLSDEDTAQIALIENIQRSNLNAIEEAKSYKEIMDLKNITQEELATILGISQSNISNKMRLLNLTPKVQDALTTNKISERHARCLLKISNPEEQEKLLERIINNKLTVKETEEIIKNSVQEINSTQAQDVLNDISINENNQKEIKGEENMNNNQGMFFPQNNIPNPINNNNEQSQIMFNSMPLSEGTNQPQGIMNGTNPNQGFIQPTITPLDSNPFMPQENIGMQENNTYQSPITNNYGQPSPMVEEPLFNPNVTIPTSPIIPENNMNPYEPVIMAQPESITPSVVPIIEPAQMPDPTINLTPPVVEPVQQPLETPLFNGTDNQILQSESSIDKVKRVLNELNDPNVLYQEYSNDTEYCIVLTIKK